MRYNESCLIGSDNMPIIKTSYSYVPKGDRRFREHFHAECEISTVLAGSGIYTVNGKNYDFSDGDVFVFSGNEKHCITKLYEQSEFLTVRFLPGILMADGGDMSLLKIFFARNKNFENNINPNNPNTAIIHKKICELAKELEEKQIGYKTQARYNLFSVFVSLVRDYDYIDDSVSYTGYKNSVAAVSQALRFIDENIEKPLTLEEIAKEAAMIPTYFSTVFKQINGISPWKYITIKRVEKAIELIKTTDMTKLDIAMQCGFTSSSNFYKAFTSVTGKRPGEY